MTSKENLHVCIDKATDEDILLHSLYYATVERADNMNKIIGLLNDTQVIRHALRSARIYKSIAPLKELSKEDKPSVAQMAILVDKKWEIGRTLRVRFLGGSDFVHRKVIRYAQEWERHVNLRFFFIESGPAEIRISFTQGTGSWSYLGTDALLINDQQDATMNYGWFDDHTPESEFSRTTLHEFGHVIGCIHEHSHPENQIPWNKEKVYAFYAKQGWSKEDVDKQVFECYDKTSTNFSTYDPHSIMHYPIPAGLLLDPHYATGLNTYLSNSDIAFAKESYPK